MKYVLTSFVTLVLGMWLIPMLIVFIAVKQVSPDATLFETKHANSMFTLYRIKMSNWERPDLGYSFELNWPWAFWVHNEPEPELLPDNELTKGAK